MIRNCFITFILFANILFSQKTIAIIKPYNTNDYMSYAVYDLIQKNLIIHSKLQVRPIYSDNNFFKIKENINKLTLENDVDITLSYNITPFRDGYLLHYIIFDISKPSEWIEDSIYSTEYSFFNSINAILKNIYPIRKDYSIKEEEYLSLIGYYNSILDNTNATTNNIYTSFYNFHNDNIYFNMDYLEYLMNLQTNSVDVDSIVTNFENNLGKNHHLYFYALACSYYNKYRVDALKSDIDRSIHYYSRALSLKNNYYLYYRRIADAYIINNDYDSAKRAFESSIYYNDYDSKIIRDFVVILKRDISKNGNDVIENLKRIISIDTKDDNIIEELARLYELIGDYDNAIFYYNKLLDVINYHLFIINNETKDAVAYDKYIAKRNRIRVHTDNLLKKINNSN